MAEKREATPLDALVRPMLPPSRPRLTKQRGDIEQPVQQVQSAPGGSGRTCRERGSA